MYQALVTLCFQEETAGERIRNEKQAKARTLGPMTPLSPKTGNGKNTRKDNELNMKIIPGS
jgi:hypothetical protein